MQNDGKEEEDERAGKLKIVMMKIPTFSLGGFLLNLETELAIWLWEEKFARSKNYAILNKKSSRSFASKLKSE